MIYKFKKNIVNRDLRPGGNNVLTGVASSEKSGLQVGDTFYLRNQKGTGDYFFIQGIRTNWLPAATKKSVLYFSFIICFPSLRPLKTS